MERGGLIIKHCNLLTLGGEELTSDLCHKTHTSARFSKNIYKMKGLIIIHSKLFGLKKEDLSSNNCYKVDIVMIW